MTMTSLASDRVWRRRMRDIDSEVKDIKMPKVSAGKEPDQDQEWCEVFINGNYRRLRFHDYDEVYRVPGLYEKLFYEKLKCCSPSCVVTLLQDVARDFGEEIDSLTVLDVGAGNGMVGDELSEQGVDEIYGVDLIPEAKEAALRDRPEIYEDYFVADLTDLPKEYERILKGADINCLTTVAALGYGDIPPLAFLKALWLIDTPGWMAFNLKEDFLRDDDSSGFNRLIKQLSREEYIQIQCYRRYPHRVSLTGRDLYYVAMVARKLKPIPDSLLEEWRDD